MGRFSKGMKLLDRKTKVSPGGTVGVLFVGEGELLGENTSVHNTVGLEGIPCQERKYGESFMD